MEQEQIIDELVCMCNDAVQCLTGGQYVGWCARMVEIVRKLGQLKATVTIDRQETEKLKKLIQDYGINTSGGTENGSI